MSAIEISNDTPADMLSQLALSIHHATGGLPVVLKSRHMPGVFVDHDSSVYTGYQSQALDQVFSDGRQRKTRVDRGKYAGMPMLISPIEDGNGHAVAVIGVIDSMGSLSLQEFIKISESLRSQIINSP